MEEELKICISEKWMHMMLESDSLMAFNYVFENGEIPWCLRMKIHKINELRIHLGVQ